jgi:two-component system sensor histidine kinase UhpB
MIQDKDYLNVLIIEDNAGDFELIKDYLSEQTPAGVEQAENFRKAAAILSGPEDSKYDVILLDLTLPDKSGEELIAEIIKLSGETPVIVLTGYTNIDFSIQSIYRGVSDYLLKDDLTSAGLYKSINYSIQRKKRARQLKESESRYNIMFQLSPQPMWLMDPETLRFVSVNAAAVKDYGYTEEEFLSMTILDIRPKEEAGRLIKYIKDRTIKNGPLAGRFQHLKKSGETIIVDIYSNFITIREKFYKLVIAIDVTEKILMERRMMDMKLQEQNRIAKAVINAQEKERTEIGEELHDNVNQLLAASKLYLNHSLSMAGNNAEFIIKVREFVSTAMDEIRKLSHALVGVTAGNNVGLCDSVYELIKSIQLVKKIEIVFSCPPHVEDTVEPGLKQVIYRIIQEQLNNILKYAEASEIKITLEKIAGDIILLVKDDGKGFDTLAARTGIGLKNINHRAAVYGGTVEISSSAGNGCGMKVVFKTGCREENNNLLFTSGDTNNN